MQYGAETPDQLPTRAQILSMSGLEFMQGILVGDIAGAPIARTLNFRLLTVEDGRVVFSGNPEFGAMNPSGAVHGGWYGALLDSALGCAVMTKVPQGSVYTTMEFKVNIIRPIPLGTEVRATGRVQHAGRSSGISNGEIRGVVRAPGRPDK